MALRVMDGISIDVPCAQPGLTLHDVFDSTTIEALAVERSPQEAGAWCYAACAEMVITFSFHQTMANQCHIVSLIKAGEDYLDFCCTTNGNECTFTGCELDDISRIFDFFQIGFETSGNAADPILGPVDLPKLTAEFQAGRPVEVIVDWDDDGSHAVLVTGVVDDMIFVIDPLEDEPYGGWQTVDSLETGFGLGSWARTWPGLRRLQ
jgi:hypothetical protein